MIQVEEKRKNRPFNGGDGLSVENQFKTLAKAYTGFRPIMLRIEGYLLKRIGEPVEMNKNDSSRKEEGKRKEGKIGLYYNDKGDRKANQFKNLTKVTAGNLYIVLSNDEVQIKRTIRKDTKSEVQFNS
jgi:hypothetical protein